MNGASSSKRPAEQDHSAAALSESGACRRTLLIDHLAPSVTEEIIKSGLSQFGNATKYRFLRADSRNPRYAPRRAVVEMSTWQAADNVVQQANSSLFLLGAVPRPVRVRFADRTVARRQVFKPAFFRRNDPEAKQYLKLHSVSLKHVLQAQRLEELQFEDCEKLDAQQREQIKTYYRYLDEVDKLANNSYLIGLYGRPNSRA